MPLIAITPREELAEMELRLGSKAAIGRVMRRDPAVVSRWMSTHRRLNAASRSSIDAAYAVVTSLTDRGYDRADLEAVLTRPWAALADQVPAELIARCEITPILDALQSTTADEGTVMPNQRSTTIATELTATIRAQPIALDPRLAGFAGHPPATPDRINLTGHAEARIRQPQGTVAGVVHDQPLSW